eukprot:1138875-Pelagomonas_calceolata.AAC.10
MADNPPDPHWIGRHRHTVPELTFHLGHLGQYETAKEDANVFKTIVKLQKKVALHARGRWPQSRSVGPAWPCKHSACRDGCMKHLCSLALAHTGTLSNG